MEEILRVENLTHTYGEGTPFRRSAVKNMDLTIYRGEFLGLIGHTGSGKSTLIQHLNGLLKPTEGRILLGGRDIWKEEKIRDVRFRVGLVFQYPEHQLFEETVYRDIAFGPKNMGLGEEEIDQRVRAAARFVGLDEATLQKSPFALSGGQKRRVAIAGVIAMEPEVLVLDEPTAGLDPQGREELLAHIRAYHRERGTTIVLVSHSMDEIAENVERIVVLKGGSVLMSGTQREVFARAEELVAAGLNVPQVTRVAMALRERGVGIDSAVYTVEELKAALLSLKGGAAC
ncbi:MAG: energy-coupling factor transporter ATPase [Oscillospiraceae bacterium]|nr:energy-coupling factor transporter ATPase [Oscillospiraceae bacterium]